MRTYSISIVDSSSVLTFLKVNSFFFGKNKEERKKVDDAYPHCVTHDMATSGSVCTTDGGATLQVRAVPLHERLPTSLLRGEGVAHNPPLPHACKAEVSRRRYEEEQPCVHTGLHCDRIQGGYSGHSGRKASSHGGMREGGWSDPRKRGGERCMYHHHHHHHHHGPVNNRSTYHGHPS